MSDIPPGGFFTPKRPSFRMTRHNNYHHRLPPPMSYIHSHRPLVSHPMFHPQQRCYMPNFSGADAPYVHVNGHGRGNLYYPNPNQQKYTDRFGNVHYNPYNRLARQQQAENYGPFQQGPFTPPPSNGIKGKGGKKRSPWNKGGGKQEKAEDQSRSCDGVKRAPSKSSLDNWVEDNAEKTQQTTSSKTSVDNWSKDEDGQTSPSKASINTDTWTTESSPECGQSQTSNDANGLGGSLANGGDEVQEQAASNAQPQLTRPNDQVYNYNSPAEDPRKRQYLNPIMYNDNWNNQGYEQNRMMPPPLQMYFDPASRGYDPGIMQQHPPIYMDPNLGLHAQQQHQLGNHFPERNIHPGAPFMQQQHYQYNHPPLEQQQVPVLQNVSPGVMQCIPNQPVRPVLYCGNASSFIDAARIGFQEFRNDHIEEKDKNEDEIQEGACGGVVAQSLLPELHDIDFANVKFNLDDRTFVDERPIISFVANDEKEFKLFEDQSNSLREIMKDIYSVNEVYPYHLKEICGVKLLPESLKVWPLAFIGEELEFWENIKDRVVNFSGASGVEDNKIVEGGGDLGYGVRGLAKLFCDSGPDLPFGYSTVVGMNVDKLVKDLDNPKPITPGFAGPLADRNHSYDFGRNEVVKGFSEYNLPNEVDETPWQMNTYEWTSKYRITSKMFPSFSLDILLFIFYTFTGDALQLLAAKELYLKGWRYHKIYKVWITPWITNGVGQSGINENGEWVSGIYKYFNYDKWMFSKGDFRINEYVLEGMPAEVRDGLWE